MASLNEIHIGQLIKSVFDTSGMSIAEFARRINCERTNVYKIFARKSIDVGLLVIISDTLQHNFLDDIIRLSGLNSQYCTKLNVCISIDDMKPDSAMHLRELIDETLGKK